MFVHFAPSMQYRRCLVVCQVRIALLHAIRRARVKRVSRSDLRLANRRAGSGTIFGRLALHTDGRASRKLVPDPFPVRPLSPAIGQENLNHTARPLRNDNHSAIRNPNSSLTLSAFPEVRRVRPWRIRLPCPTWRRGGRGSRCGSRLRNCRRRWERTLRVPPRLA